MSDSTGETESTAGATSDPTSAEKAESEASDLAVDENADTSVDGSSDASLPADGKTGKDGAPLPDLSDIEGATTGPMTIPDDPAEVADNVADNAADKVADEVADADRPEPAPTGELLLESDTKPGDGKVESNWAAPSADAIKESVDSESGKTEPGKTEPGKTEPGKTESGKTEPPDTAPVEATMDFVAQPPPPTAADAVASPPAAAASTPDAPTPDASAPAASAAPPSDGPAVTGQITAEELAAAASSVAPAAPTAPPAEDKGTGAAETVIVPTTPPDTKSDAKPDAPDPNRPVPPAPPAADATVQIPTGDSTAVLPVLPLDAPAPADVAPSTPATPATPATPIDPPSAEAAGATQLVSPIGSDTATEITPSVAMANAASTSVAKPDAPDGKTPDGKTPDGKIPDPTSDIVVGTPEKKRHLLRNLALVALVLVAVFIGAWLFDSVRTSDQVLRNTTLGTTAIGGLTSNELDSVIDAMNDDLADTPVTISVGETMIETDPVALGAELDRDAIKEEALDAGRGGNIFMRPFNWIGSFNSERTVEASYTIAEGQDPDDLPGVITDALGVPVEPELALRGSNLTVVPGAEGETIDGAQLQELLPAELSGEAPYAIDIDPVATQPEYADEQIQDVVDNASEVTADPVIFRVLDQTTEVDSGELRSWIRLETEDGEADWVIDQEASAGYLKPLFPSLGAEDQIASFSVVEGEPIIIPASETVICCDDDSIADVREALTEPLPPPPTNEDDEAEAEDDDEELEPALRIVDLEPEIVGSDEGVAELESLGIIEEVSTFETNHACCAPRVVNIQRFADLMRGVIIRPGEDFSLNGHVGRRTIENGFAADSAIANGILEPQVGGGISQFATTFFNASFFAGIEFNEYQSHSLLISRYPRGREATISFPRPDLSVKNTTPYGILVWTSYTPTSIRVTFYSTKYVDVEALPVLRSAQGSCTRYTTPRVRTYIDDDRVVEDSVFGVYRPGEGFDCNGNSTRPEDDPAGPTLPQPEPGSAPETPPVQP